jgi:hypothetical protein
MMAPPKIQQSLPLYKGIMEEIRIRLDAINSVLRSAPPLPEVLIAEFCLLQLRMICELIALACLVAHGDITKTNRLTREYKADFIVSNLEPLNPDFFPRAVQQVQRGPGRFELPPKQSGFLTKPEFLKLYREKFGNALHRGSLKRLLSSKRDRNAPLGEIAVLVARIQGLLDHHIITLHGGNFMLACGMVTRETGGTTIALFQKADLTNTKA